MTGQQSPGLWRKDFAEGTAGFTSGGPNRACVLSLREETSARAAGIHRAELRLRRAAQERGGEQRGLLTRGSKTVPRVTRGWGFTCVSWDQKP